VGTSSLEQNFTRKRGEIQIQEAKGFLFSPSGSPRLRVTTSFLLNFGVQIHDSTRAEDFAREAFQDKGLQA
jgi:hypothetical protein